MIAIIDPGHNARAWQVLRRQGGDPWIIYDVGRMPDGRTLGSDTVTFSRGGRIMSRATILWRKDEPDLIRHTALVEMPHVTGPDDRAHRTDSLVFPGGIARVGDGINEWSADQPGREPVPLIGTKASEDLPMVANQAVVSVGHGRLAHRHRRQKPRHARVITDALGAGDGIRTAVLERRRYPDWGVDFVDESYADGRSRPPG